LALPPRALSLSLLLVLVGTTAYADEPTASVSAEAPKIDPAPLLHSRLGAWQLHMAIVTGVEPVDGSNAVAFGASVELLYHCRLGVFAALTSSKGNAIIATTDSKGNTLPAPADRISVPLGLAVHPFGNLGMRPGSGFRGWAHRLAAGLGLELGVSVEHIRDSGSSATNPGLHAALGLDVPLYGGPVEGGLMLHMQGRLIVAPAVTLEGGSSTPIHMPAVGGQFYGGLMWAL
jgi:hypothetical protein